MLASLIALISSYNSYAKDCSIKLVHCPTIPNYPLDYKVAYYKHHEPHLRCRNFVNGMWYIEYKKVPIHSSPGCKVNLSGRFEKGFLGIERCEDKDPSKCYATCEPE